MNWLTRSCLTAAVLLGVPAALQAQPLSLPLEIRQQETFWNLQSVRGVPITTSVNPNNGSDGRMTTVNESGSALLPTTNQFANLISMGGLPGLRSNDWFAVSNSVILKAGTNAPWAITANEMKLPVARSNNAIVMVLRRAQVGVPFLTRQVSFPFGSVIDVPLVNEGGLSLTNIAPSAYWLPEPYTTTGHTNSGYYWSPHARKVYATQPGPLSVRWLRAAYSTSKPTDYDSNPANYAIIGGNYFRLYIANYIVSGSPVKTPRHMYWTERGFRMLGKPIAVPAARVGAVAVAYNNNFPRTVPQQYVGPGDTDLSAGTTNQTLQELRTLWYDQTQGSIYAYNQEGRVFLELLGDLKPDGETREQLGFEIVDVFKQPTPNDVRIDLGERVTPPPPGSVDELTPEPVLQVGTSTFDYQHSVADALEIFAARETINENDYLVHWMETSLVGLKWPLLLGRYQLAWPLDVARYSHYVRPLVATEAEARLTAVPLSTDNVPTIAYQDPLDRPRAKLTDSFGFYTFLDVAHPAHRTLLRFNSGENVAFERVFSWLDQSLINPNLTLPTFSSQFGGDTPGAIASGSAYVEDGILHLTDNVNNQNGDFILEEFASGQTVQSFRATFALSMGGPAPRPADGFSFNFGTIVSPIPFPEEGIASGLSVCFDIYDNDANDRAPAISIKRNNVTLAAVSMGETNLSVNPDPTNLPIPIDPATDQPMTMATASGTFAPVQIVLHKTGGMDVWYKDVKVLTNIATGYTPRTGKFGLAARTGGANCRHWVDDLVIVVNQESNVSPPDFVDSVATNLTSWDNLAQTFNWPSALSIPRVVNATVDVGQRLTAPDGEVGAGQSTDYLAGYILQSQGTSFNPQAYVDPFSSGFATANRSAIIPVNAIPGANALEVWWFRPNQADATRGFATNHWPSVLGRYTIQWPTSPAEIVLASKLGSRGNGPLNSFQVTGQIYTQNNPALPGYNPNEEHAIMSGESAFATRDDLNITTAIGYSSHPFVLLQYTAEDGRPAMLPFKVLREKPSAGWVFDYVIDAGRLLQPPMPLPLLGKPTEGSGDNTISYNVESTVGFNDLPGNWNTNTSPDGPFGHYGQFTFRDRKQDYWVYRARHAGLLGLRVGSYNGNTGAYNNFGNATAVVNVPFSFWLHSSRQAEYLAIEPPANLPNWLSIEGLNISGTPTTDDIGTNTMPLVVYDRYDDARWTNTLTLSVVASGSVVTLGPLSVFSSNKYTGTVISFTNRPPFLSHSPAPNNSFTMRYYYKTEPSFAWPGVVNPPPAGSIVPYLRALTNGVYVGDPTSKATPALDIVYRPAWPVLDVVGKPLPTVPYGYTVSKPENGFPGVRDWKTARILYQQSLAININATGRVEAVLHDPTREKSASITSFGMQALPSSVRTEVFQGKVYFPNLPPHLGKRLFFDPTRGAKGSLVLRGEFKDEAFGSDYLLLNVLRGSDLAAAKALCPSSDTANFQNWTNAIEGLVTVVDTFYEDPNVPGSYIPNPALAQSIGVGGLAEISSDNMAVDSYALSASGPGAGYITLVEANGTAFTEPGDPVAMHVLKVGGSLYEGELKVIPAENPLSEMVTFQHTPDLGGRFAQYEYEWKIAAPVDGLPPAEDPTNSVWLSLTNGLDVPRYVLGGNGIRVLGDNYVTVRYRPKNGNHPLLNVWSAWTTPQLAEGWIKRVLAGINPFNQRIRDLFNNAVNTDASLLTQAGRRWEGDVALNLDTINNYGLIEIYETILRRGRSISIESGYNYGPANDALLLAAGYLSDLYMLIGNEAWADAANPTIGIGTANNTYGDIATALFSFKGQVPSLLEEELAMLRGRDDFLLPGVATAPVYNRLVWNYTRGIDAGEVTYAINYNVQENPNRAPDGVIDAEDAALMFPQGHGDAYGHYLTALKGYYSLLLNSYFDWVPRTEAVLVLGQPVSVDYQDERKFAAAAAAVGRAGRQIFDLTWRRDYEPEHESGWSHFSPTRDNTQRDTTRYWGLDHWASRVGLGNYVNWVTGNAILPDVDPNPSHEGIQKIDRTTVPELSELATMAGDLQMAMDSAEGGLTPVGLPQDGVALDINPNVVVGPDNGTHFEQIYGRAKVALNNAVAAFDDAKDVTRLMRSEQDSLANFQAGVARQELTYSNALIEIYGTPYADDIGPSGTYPQGYAGPDLLHFAYVDPMPLAGLNLISNAQQRVFKIDIQDFPASFDAAETDSSGFNSARARFDFVRRALIENPDIYRPGLDYVSFTLDSSGVFEKPSGWAGRRASPGKLQEAISRIQLARNAAFGTLSSHEALKRKLDRSIEYFEAQTARTEFLEEWEQTKAELITAIQAAAFVGKMGKLAYESFRDSVVNALQTAKEAVPQSTIVGTAVGGDTTSAARASIQAASSGTQLSAAAANFAKEFALGAFTTTKEAVIRLREAFIVQPLLNNLSQQHEVLQLDATLVELQQTLFTINQRLQEVNDAVRSYQSLVAQGDRLQQERQVYRQRASAVVQGYRARDAAFRSFRNEKLERYKTLFDLSARYAFLAANAYDYETGLLSTSSGRSFVHRILSARALGIVRNGEPQYAGSNTGDPGLSSALAEMKADWDTVKGRLGFNNPDAYGTTLSLRMENFRILPGTNSDVTWKDVLQQSRKVDVLADEDVRRHCRQLTRGAGMPVPGIVIEFSTTIADGYNFFGQQLAAGDHSFSPSSFATKIFGVGAALEGYLGMDEPAANAGAGGNSPPDPNASLLDPLAMAATPYVYLIPVGVDSMRTPPLGDAAAIRTWDVKDVAIPLPYNIGAVQLANGGFYQSADALSEPLYALRKHQAFRPVPSASFFSTDLYGGNGTLARSQYTNNRLIGRSAWNSRWKLVIPGHTLLNDPDEGLERFIKTVRDIKLHFVTYSYSGN